MAQLPTMKLDVDYDNQQGVLCCSSKTPPQNNKS